MNDPKDHRLWMQIALEEARLSGEDVPVGCIIVSDTGTSAGTSSGASAGSGAGAGSGASAEPGAKALAEVIGRGHNERETTGDPTAHAEIVALRQAAKALGTWRLAGVTLYTTLEPCPMCAEAIIQSRVSKVIFGAYDNVSGALGSKFNLFCAGRIYPIPEVLGGVEEQLCREILTNYFALKSKR
jgi:tRNA(adenine34) deaminase